MDITPIPQKRVVIPNWRYYDNTSILGELDSYSAVVNSEKLYPIDDYINDWIGKKSLYRASDLISAAICNSQKDNPHVLEAAKFVLETCHQNSSIAQESTAKYVLGSDDSNDSHIDRLQKDALGKLENVVDLHKTIRTLRLRAHAYPYNAIVYVDMARAYTTLGMRQKAENMMQIALYLDPHNRFVARAAARFYIHFGDKDRAAEIIRKTGYAKHDPWLMASDIAITMLRDKRSSNLKNGEKIIFSDRFTPFGITELASAIGTIELIDGSRKKSRNIFNRSLVNPNDNSLAQAQWAVQNGNLSLVFGQLAVPHDYESEAFRMFSEGKYDKALDSAVDWICDIPFSEKAVKFGYEVSTTYLKKYNVSSKILEIGLKAHPNDKFMLNNRAYVNAVDNNIEEAKKDIERLESICSINEEGTVPACMTATRGLIFYREGMTEQGREKYAQAIKMAENLNDRTLIAKAKLNKIREELIVTKYQDEKSLKELNTIDISDCHPEVAILLADIRKMVKKQND